MAWGELAKSIGENIKKGRKVYICGRLQTRSWETPDGKKKWTTEIIADEALALGAQDAELGAPDKSEAAADPKVTISEPVVKGSEEKVVPENPTSVPAINYESEIKPEDLPF